MKKIAITQRIYKFQDYSEERECLDINWIRLFKELNFIPVILSCEINFKNLNFSGVVLSGGNTLNSIKKCPYAEKRDFFEKKLIEYCITNSIPVFGVCRGMQILAEYFGSDFKEVKNHTAQYHPIIGNFKSLKRVNSYHDYSINNLSGEFDIVAKSEDGNIEAIKHKKYKIFAQMWHPERETPFIKEELNVIEGFLN